MAYEQLKMYFETTTQNTSSETFKPKKKKKKKNTETKEDTFSFQPLGVTQTKETIDTKSISIPFEDEFISLCPIKFFPLQLEAIRWMYWIEATRTLNQQVGGILGDVMGLGKTIDAIGMVAYDYFLKNKRSNGNDSSLYSLPTEAPTLVVTPLTLVSQWKAEAVKKFQIPENHIFIYRGVKRITNLQKMKENGKLPSLVITNYETIQKVKTYETLSEQFQDYENSFKDDFKPNDDSGIFLLLKEKAKEDDSKIPLFKIYWKRCFFDEAQFARNSKTNTYRSLLKILSESKWCVTGTPIVNYTADIRILSKLCTPNFPLTYKSYNEKAHWKNLFFLRRSKEMLNLPKMTKTDIWLDFTKEESDEYIKLETWAYEIYEDLIKCQSLAIKILYILCRLRQACDHLMLQEGSAVTSKILEDLKKEYNVEDILKKESMKRKLEYEKIYELGNFRKKKKLKSIVLNNYECDFVVENQKDIKKGKTFSYSTKLSWTRDFVGKILSQDNWSKIVIFSQFSTMLDLTECMLIKEGIKSLRFDGKINSNFRERVKEIFTTDPSYRIILVSLKIGGFGLNLVAANYLLNLDPWWNIPAEAQAEDRVHRIGQKNEVFVFRILITGSIEEEVLKIQRKKNSQENSFYEEDDIKNPNITEIESVFSTIRTRYLKKSQENK